MNTADFFVDRLKAWGVKPHFRLFGRRHQRRHRRAPARRRDRLHPAAARGDGARSWRSPTPSSPASSASASRPAAPARPTSHRALRRARRPYAGAGDLRPGRNHRARRELSAGTEPRPRCSPTSPNMCRKSAIRRSLPHVVDRAIRLAHRAARAVGDHPAQGRAGAGLRSAEARARLHAVGTRLFAAGRSCRRKPTCARPPKSSTPARKWRS